MVVVGFDGTEPSLRAVAYAAGVARREQCDLVVGAVGPDVEPLPADSVVRLDDWVRGHWRLEELTGPPADALERLAEEVRADAIVVGRSRNPELHRLGSVSARLVSRANHPVVIVP